VRQVPPIARAALVLLPTVRMEVQALVADRDAAERDLKTAGRKADEQRDAAERFVRLAGKAQGAEQVLQLLGRLARGDTPS
jgi:hypothetical protein